MQVSINLLVIDKPKNKLGCQRCPKYLRLMEFISLTVDTSHNVMFCKFLVSEPFPFYFSPFSAVAPIKTKGREGALTLPHPDFGKSK